MLVKKVLLVLIAAGILGYSTKKENTTAVIADKSISKYKPIKGHLVCTYNVNGESNRNMDDLQSIDAFEE